MPCYWVQAKRRIDQRTSVHIYKEHLLYRHVGRLLMSGLAVRVSYRGGAVQHKPWGSFRPGAVYGVSEISTVMRHGSCVHGIATGAPGIWLTEALVEWLWERSGEFLGPSIHCRSSKPAINNAVPAFVSVVPPCNRNCCLQPMGSGSFLGRES